MARKWLAWVLGAALLLTGIAGGAIAEGAERSIVIRADYDGAWVNVNQHQFKIFLPDGWELIDDGGDGALMTAVDPETGNRMWIESLQGDDFTMDGVFEMFSQEEGFESMQKLYINDHPFVHYISPEDDVRGFITLTADAKHLLVFKFSPADDEAFTRYAEMIMSTLSAYTAKAAAKESKGEKKKQPTLVMTWAELVAAAKAGKTKISVGANLVRGDDEEVVVFHKSVTIKSAGGNGQYALNGNGAQIMRIQSDTDDPLTGRSKISGLVFFNAEAENGGALFAQGDLAVKDCVFFSNAASGAGGAIYVTGDLELIDSLLLQNAAGTHGGGVYASGNVTVENSDITLNTAGTYGGGIVENPASAHGGGIYASENVTVENSHITGNTAGMDGGGIYASYGDVYIESGVIAGNRAGREGGGVNAIGVVVNGGEISGNTADTCGGGIYAYNGDVTVNEGGIYSNTAQYGGGICADNNGDVTVNGGEISGNMAEDGGGIYAYSGDVTVNGGEISGNMAEDGGGIYADNGGDVTVNEGGIYSNTATQAGGGIYADNGGDVTVNGGEISGNMAEDGGGIYTDGGDVTVNEGGIYSNTAQYGGGIYADNYGDVTVNGGEISDNTATQAGGGDGVYADRGAVSDPGGNIKDDVVTVD